MPQAAVETGTPPPPAPIRRQLGLVDAASILVGIIIGAGFLISSPLVASSAGSYSNLLIVWLVGGATALLGAACYAELSTALPEEGGEYVYLKRAFGTRVGFLFAWTAVLVVRPGNIGALALTFATYAAQVVTPAGQGPEPMLVLGLACGAVGLLTGVNALGLRRATWTQNALTAAKVIGLLALFAVAMIAPARAAGASSTPAFPPGAGNFGLAMVMVLFAFGGWEDVTYVAAEVRDPRRTLPRALLAGTAAVTAIYLFGTVAFVNSLGWEGLAKSDAVAADVVRGPLGDAAARGVSLLVALCAFGAINGMILTGSRISFAAAADHPALRKLGAWDGGRGVPMRSLLLQAAITLGLLLLMGRNKDAFERMVSFTVPAFWTFYVLVGVGLIVLRLREPALVRPFRVPVFPVTPILFCLTGLFMLYSGVFYVWEHRGGEAFWAIGAVVSGLILMPWARNRYSTDGPRPRGVVETGS